MRSDTYLEVDLDQLEKNFEHLNELLKGAAPIFMVKANGYGHGLLPMSKFSYEYCGVRHLGVASAGEAAVIKKEMGQSDLSVLVFSDTDIKGKFWQEDAASSCVPVISNFSDLNHFLANSEFAKTPMAIKLDSGMNRMGFRSDQIEELIQVCRKSGRKEIDHLMTHFSCSFRALGKDQRTYMQLERFEAMEKEIRGAGLSVGKISLSNSGAICIRDF